MKTRKRHTWKPLPILAMVMIAATLALPSWAQEPIIVDDTIPFNPPDPIIEPVAYHGKVDGNFAVSPTGGATYTVPIEIPPGVGGMQPQIAITYNSQSSMGLAGWGCSLTGYSSITRGPKDIFHDGTARGMSYGADDAYYLNGKRLILASGTEGMPYCTYRPEGDPYTSVTVRGAYFTTSDERYFEVRSPDGITALYGSTTASRQGFYSGGGKVAAWYLRSATDTLGNSVEWDYARDQLFVYPTHVTYGGGRVEFSYTTLGNAARPFRLMGVAGTMDRLLTGITCKYGGTTLRQYALTYDTTSDGPAVKFPRLIKVAVADGNGQELRPLLLDWDFMPGNTMSRTTYSYISRFEDNLMEDYLGNVFTNVDVNHDGIDDIVEIAPYINTWDNDSYTKVIFHLSSRGGDGNLRFDHSYLTYMSGCSIGRTPAIGSSFSIDYHGDGRQCLMVPCRIDNPQGKISQINFELFKCVEDMDWETGWIQQTLSVGMYTPSDDFPLFAVGNFDGSGRQGIIVIEREDEGDGNYRGHVLSDDPNWATDSLFFRVDGKPQSLFVGDFDNNGMADLMIVHDNGYKIFWNKVGNSPTLGFFGGYPMSGTSVRMSMVVRQGDFNGDGLVDFVLNSERDDKWYLALNNGNGTFTKTLAATLGVFDQETDNDDGKLSCEILDFDNDGLSDVVFSKAMFDGNSFQKTHTLWLRSTGSALSVVRHATSMGADDALPQYFSVGDFNGDGYADLMNYGYDCANGNNSTASPSLGVYLVNGLSPSSGKATTITDGLCNVHCVGYASLTSPDMYSSETGSPYPVIDAVVPLHVVRTVRSSTASSESPLSLMTETRHYGGLKVHVAGKGILGFSETSSYNDVTLTHQREWVSAWDTISYVPKTINTSFTVGGQTASTRTEMEVWRTWPGNFFAHPIDAHSIDLDDNPTRKTTEFDMESGVLKGNWVRYGTGNDMDRETYHDSLTFIAGRWLPQITYSRQRHKDDTQDFQTVRKMSYNEVGLPNSVTENYGTPLALATSYTYDQWGNVTSETVSGSGLNAVTAHYEYDPTHRFVSRRYTTPASTVTEYTYDAWGNVLTETDATDPANPLTTTNAYDGFGNLMHSVSPEGIATSVTRTLSGDLRHYETLEQTDGRPWQTTLRDGRGNVVSTHSVGVMDIAIGDSTVYDARGNATKRMATNGELTTVAETAYDLRNRPTTETLSTGSVTTYAYGNRKVTAVTDGKTTETTYDAWGNVKKCQRPYGTVTYAYASNGKPSAASTGNATVTMQYDACGNQTRLVDPDAGTMQYTYNAAGRVVSQTDARGVTTTDSLDALNRVVRKTTGGTVVNYAYGTAGNASQRLTQQTTPTHGISYTYDVYGRVITETRNYGSTQYTFTHMYDSLGNLLQTAYPGNVTVSHVYDAYGNEVRMDVGGVPVWELVSHDGLVTEESLGSPPVVNDSLVLRLHLLGTLMRTTSRDDAGLLASISLRKRDNTPLHSMSFTHDPLTGNLTSRSGMIPGEGELFTYDAEDRLVRYQNDHGHWDDICQYTADGNIQYRTGLGYYDYHPTSDVRPHAVKGVENTSGRISGDSHDLTFNDLGKVSYINSHENGSYGIVYGPDGERWESSLYKTGYQWPDTVRRYVGDMEIVSSGPSEVCRFYYLGHGVVLRKVNNAVTPLYAFTDNLGSVTRLYTETGMEKFRAQYDPWGVQVVNRNDINFARGYCGHEMLNDFQLINMNGRMYDPVLGRFLSPDNYVQMPSSAQGFNRYSYCLNNPLKYVDPDGELWWLVVGAAVVGGIFNVVQNDGSIHGMGDFIKCFGIGAISGAAGALTGYGVCTALSFGGFLGGAISGLAGGTVSGGILGGGNAWIDGTDFWQGFGHGAIYGGIIGGIGGGIIGGVCSVVNGNNFWTGAAKQAIIKPEVNWDPDVIPEPMRGTQTFEPQWHDLPETPMPEWVQTPWQKGQAGVERAVNEFVNQGGHDIVREVTIEVNGVRTRLDFIGYDKDGVLSLFEVKNGPKASFTPNQKIIWPQIENKSSFFNSGSNSMQFIPIGKNAAMFKELLPYEIARKPYIGNYNATIIWY